MRIGVLYVLTVAALLGVPAAHAAGTSHVVRIEGMKFVPERLEVAAGDTVTWTNKDFVPHTVTAADAGVESGTIAANETWKFVAGKKGEMNYICRLHPLMRGVVTVK